MKSDDFKCETKTYYFLGFARVNRSGPMTTEIAFDKNWVSNLAARL